jgi:uncharacterized membrane protein YqiK
VVGSPGLLASPLAPRQPAPTLTAQALRSTLADPLLQSAQITDIIPVWVFLLGGLVLVGITLPQIGWVAGLIVIGEREVGIITKKFAVKSLPAGRLIALHGEAGLQADTLPPGWHFGYFPWQYRVKKEGVTVIPQGEIGLVVANDGNTIPSDRILGKITPCDDFQNARAFLTQGGENGGHLSDQSGPV